MTFQSRFLVPVFIFALLGACATVPPGPPPDVRRLENELDRLHNDPAIAPNAQGELRDADAAVSYLSIEYRHMDARDYAHCLYVADRLVRIAEAEGRARYASVRAKDLGAERDRLMVEARTRDLHIAQVATANALATADAERQNAEIARADAQAARADATSTRGELESLRADLADLQAQQTQRGLVVTLGDVLFETDRAELKPGAERLLDGLVRALHDDPNASVEIDGHTDSTGSRNYNIDLSLRRAQAVQGYLLSRGIDPSRMTAQGFGPDYPIASNDTEAGRQQNRRVEVIVQVRVAQR